MEQFRVEQKDTDMKKIYDNLVEPNLKNLNGIAECVKGLEVYKTCLGLLDVDSLSKRAMQKEIEQIIVSLNDNRSQLWKRTVGMVGNFASMDFIAKKNEEFAEQERKAQTKINEIIRQVS